MTPGTTNRCDAGADHDQTGRDLEVLAIVGRMYLDALDADPDNEMLTLPGALLVTEVREAVERQERSEAGERRRAAAMSDDVDRVFLGDPSEDDDRNSVLAIATNTTEDNAVWLEMWSDGRKVAETAVLSDKQRQTVRALLA